MCEKSFPISTKISAIPCAEFGDLRVSIFARCRPPSHTGHARESRAMRWVPSANIHKLLVGQHRTVSTFNSSMRKRRKRSPPNQSLNAKPNRTNCGCTQMTGGGSIYAHFPKRVWIYRRRPRKRRSASFRNCFDNCRRRLGCECGPEQFLGCAVSRVEAFISVSDRGWTPPRHRFLGQSSASRAPAPPQR